MISIQYFTDESEHILLTQEEDEKISVIWGGHAEDTGTLLCEIVSLHPGVLQTAIAMISSEDLRNPEHDKLANLYWHVLTNSADVEHAIAKPRKAIQLFEALFYVADTMESLDSVKEIWMPAICAAIESVYELTESISEQDDVEAALLDWMQNRKEMLFLPSQRIMRRSYFFPDEPDALIRVLSIPVVDDKGTSDSGFMTYLLCGLLDHALRLGVPLRRCQHCGGFFLPKERRDERYCRRMTKDGPCNIIGPRAQYQQTKGVNPYIKAFKTAYNKYRYQEKTGMITSIQFNAWADTARALRDEQIEGESSLAPAEFKKVINEKDFFDTAQTHS